MSHAVVQEHYTVPLPDGITAFDLDVIKLTAQFVARNGKSFLTGLTSREHTNPQFSFLRPSHSMFTFFTALADAYSKVLMPPKSLAERLRRDATVKPAILERCLKRLEWERSQALARKDADEKAEAERDAMVRTTSISQCVSDAHPSGSNRLARVHCC